MFKQWVLIFGTSVCEETEEPNITIDLWQQKDIEAGEVFLDYQTYGTPTPNDVVDAAHWLLDQWNVRRYNVEYAINKGKRTRPII